MDDWGEIDKISKKDMELRDQRVRWFIHKDAEVTRNDDRKNRQKDSVLALKTLMNEDKECINVYFKRVES